MIGGVEEGRGRKRGERERGERRPKERKGKLEGEQSSERECLCVFVCFVVACVCHSVRIFPFF